MKERPILFSGAMVRALLDGSKTQTRRIMKPQPHEDARFSGGYAIQPSKRTQGAEISVEAPYVGIACPYGQPGDRLWVRETWRGIVQINGPHESYETGVARYVPDQEYCKRVEYAATDKANETELWRPSIHMPRWMSRTLLEIVSVRIERLQDISEADALAEGVKPSPGGMWSAAAGQAVTTPAAAYGLLWESINGPGSWALNPWVWCVEFSKVKP